MAKLIVNQGGRKTSVDLVGDVLFVGTAADCAVRIPEEGVEERHCQILKVDNRYRVVNLGKGVTKVNGEVVAQSELANGDVIQIGAASIVFLGGVQPQSVPPTAAPPRPRAVVGGGHGGRSRRTSTTGRSGSPEIRVGERMRKAATQREMLSRRRLRKPGLSGPATIGIATAVSLVVIIFGYNMLKSVPSDALGAQYAKAQDLIQNSRYDEARAVLESIPPGAANYRQAQQMLKDMQARAVTGIDLTQHQHGEADYQSNILEFIRVKIETDNSKYAGDTAYIRVIVKRLKTFLREFKGHKREAEVKALLAKYRSLVPTKSLVWHDVAVDADVERARGMYGPAFKPVTEWIATHPQGDEYELKQAGRLRDKIMRGAKQWWADEDKRAKENITRDQLSAAYSKYLTAERRLKGIPDMYQRARKMAQDLKRKAGELIVTK